VILIVDTMKILRFTENKASCNEPKIGVLINGQAVEVAQSIFDFPLSEEELDKKQEYSLDEITILPPVSPSKVVAVGLNYKDHADELNMEIPEEPIIFIMISLPGISRKKMVSGPDPKVLTLSAL